MLTHFTYLIIKLLCYSIFYNVQILANIHIIDFFYVKIFYIDMTHMDNIICLCTTHIDDSK